VTKQQLLDRIERLESQLLLVRAQASAASNKPQSIITWQPGAVNPVPPVYNDWNQIEAVVNALQGNAILITDDTGTPGFMHVPSTANLDGRGRLEIVGGGPNGESEVVIDDGGQLQNVRSWRTIAVRSEPTIKPSILYNIDGLIVECLDATFLFDNGGGGTLPVIECDPASYMGFFFIASSELRNSHNPGHAVLNVGNNVLLFFTINCLDFPSTFDTTISGPATSSIQFQLDASVPQTISLPAFLGATSIVQIDDAVGVTYTPADLVHWSGVAPTSVKNALDRIAAKITPIP
jgi:hypothetical protein